jgi:hypothetical protein
VADQRRPNGVSVSEEIMPAAPPPLTGMLKVLPLADHDFRLISLVKGETYDVKRRLSRLLSRFTFHVSLLTFHVSRS